MGRQVAPDVGSEARRRRPQTRKEGTPATHATTARERAFESPPEVVGGGAAFGGTRVARLQQDVVEAPTVPWPVRRPWMPRWQRRKMEAVQPRPCLVERTAQGEDVERGRPQPVGRHVALGARELDAGPGLADGAVVGEGPSAAAKEDVGGLDVAMEQAGRMEPGQGTGDADALLEDVQRGHGPGLGNVRGQRQRRVQGRIVGIEGTSGDGVVGEFQFLPEAGGGAVDAPTAHRGEAVGGQEGLELVPDAREVVEGLGPGGFLDLEARVRARRVEGEVHPGTRADRQGPEQRVPGRDEVGDGHGALGPRSGSTSMASSARTAHWRRMRRIMRLRIMRTLNCVVLKARATSGDGTPWKE